MGIVTGVLKLLGIGGDGSVVNTAVGVLSHSIMLPLIGYLLYHADDTIHFNTSLGFLALVVGVGYFALEVARRN